MTTMMKTITEVIQVSRQLVQVILRRLGAHFAEELPGLNALLRRRRRGRRRARLTAAVLAARLRVGAA